LSLCTGTRDVWLHAFLTWDLGGGEWSTSRSGRFTPGVKTPDTNWIGGWVDTSDSLYFIISERYNINLAKAIKVGE